MIDERGRNFKWESSYCIVTKHTSIKNDAKKGVGTIALMTFFLSLLDGGNVPCGIRPSAIRVGMLASRSQAMYLKPLKRCCSVSNALKSVSESLYDPA